MAPSSTAWGRSLRRRDVGLRRRVDALHGGRSGARHAFQCIARGSLIANNHILTAPQFEKMAKIMRGERYGIFCFTRSSDANDPVVVLSSNPYGLQLATGIDRL